MLFTLMEDLFACTDGETTASHSSALSTRLLDVANELTDVIWYLQSVRLMDSVRMSSACDNAPRNSPFILRPHLEIARVRSATRRAGVGGNVCGRGSGTYARSLVTPLTR